MEPIWSPSPERIRSAQLTRFMHFVAERHRRRCTTTPRCIAGRSSIRRISGARCGTSVEVRAEDRATQVLEDGNRMPGAKWFLDARFNYAENLLRLDDDGAAIISLQRDAASVASCRGGSCAARSRASPTDCGSAGVVDRRSGRGLSCRTSRNRHRDARRQPVSARSGLPAPPDFGVSGVLDRFGQITPKVLFAADGYQYAGKTFDCMATVQAIKDRIPSLERVVLVPYLRQAASGRPGAWFTSASFGRADAPRSPSRSCRSIIPRSFSIPPARPACRNASCTAPAARCCNS